MSEITTSNGAASSTGEVVRGEGNAPGQGAGELMPSVTTNERGRLSDFKRAMAEKNNGGPSNQQQRPQTAGTRVGAFSQQLEARQQEPVMPGEPARRPDERPVQLSEPQEGGQEVPEEQQEAQPEAAVSLDDRKALEKFRQWEQDDMFPAELEAKLHEVKVNGQVRYVPTSELRQGYMRGGDYRRAYNEVQTQQQAIARERQSIQQHFQAINDPGQMLEIYERNGYGQTLEKMTDLIVERRQQRKAIIEGAGIAAMRALGMRQADWNHKDVVAAMQQAEQRLIASHNADIRQRQLDFRERQMQLQQQNQQNQQQQSQYQALYDRQITQLRPNAFRAYGIPDTAGNRQALYRHIKGVVSTIPLGEAGITRQHVMAAASDLKDELDDVISRERGLDGKSQAQMLKRATSQPLPPNRVGGGGGNPLGNLGGKQQGSIRDLEAMVRKGRLQ